MNLNDTLHGYDRSLAKVPSDMPGEIGAVINGKRRTNVVGRGGFVYVRLRTNLSEPIQAYNDKVFPGFGVAVIVRWVNNRYEIIGRDSQRYQEWETDTPEIAKHGSSHSLDVEGNNIGTDPVWVYPYQVLPGLVSPYSQSGAQNVYVHPFPILYGGEWMYVGNTGTPSLTVYSPTSGTVLVLIAMDAETGNPALFASTGSYISWNISGSNSLVPNLPYLDTVRYLPLAFAALQSGTTSMSWSNLRDLRQWISVRSTGTTFDLAANIHSAVSDLSFHDDDEFPKSDSQDSWGLKNFTWANAKTALNALYAALTHTHAASEITSGTMATARLGSGTANSATYLRGDQTYATPKQSIVFGGHGIGGTVPASTTYYLVPMISGLNTSTVSFPIPKSGTIKNLYFRLASAQPASGSLVIEIYGGATATTATGVKITIPASGAMATYSDLSNTFNHTAGELVHVRITNNATAASGIVGGVAFEVELNTG